MFFCHKEVAACWNEALGGKCVQNTFWLAKTANHLVGWRCSVLGRQEQDSRCWSWFTQRALTLDFPHWSECIYCQFNVIAGWESVKGFNFPSRGKQRLVLLQNESSACWLPLKLWVGFSYLKKSSRTIPEFHQWPRQPLAAAPCAVPTCCLDGTFCVLKEGPVQVEQSLGSKAEPLRNPPATEEQSQCWGAAKERLQLRLLLDRAIPQSSSLGKAQISSSSLSQKCFMSLTNTAYFSFVLCWAQTEACYCLAFSQVEFLPLYLCISGIRRLRNFPGSCIFPLAG